MKVRKAVITAAGWGTRFLPVTRSQPKEMLPLVDKPLIQYAVEEAINSGIEQIIMVTAMGKRAIEDYFDRSIDLEIYLERKGETEKLRKMLEISSLADIFYVRQKEQLGLGHAVLMVKEMVGNEPFALMLPDDIIDSPVPGLKQMLAVFEKYNAGILAVEKVAETDTSKYGIIDPEPLGQRIYQVKGLVEKPEPAEAPSRLGIIGRYILPPRIFDILKYTLPGKGNEIQLTDALSTLLKEQTIYACELEGARYDAGGPLGWLKANIALGLKHNGLGSELREYMKQVLKPGKNPEH
jgi:UTP--glucose-1-phosphate uridylyltransferase